MTGFPHEPLTNEERALAQRLARVGPSDGPSSALDARILAAAHAAVATKPAARSRVQQRWPAFAGMAAMLVIAVGLAWQLQPLWNAMPSLSRDASVAAAPEATAAADEEAVVQIAMPDQPVPPYDNPPPLPQEQAPQPVLGRTRARPAPPMVAAERAAENKAVPGSPHFVDEAVHGDHAPTELSAAEARQSDAAGTGWAGQEREAPAAFPAPAQPAAAPLARKAAPTLAPAIAPAIAAEPAADARRAESDAASSAKATAQPQRAAAAATATATAENTTLDSVVVTGSRLQTRDIPLRNDAALTSEQWLLRIRARRDEGDTEGARKSLLMFRKEHPRVRVPDDLRKLLR